VEIKSMSAVGGDRTHVLRITDLILYFPATAATYMKRLQFGINGKKFPVKDIFYHLLLYIYEESNLFIR
jgi:hypothetical protein